MKTIRCSSKNVNHSVTVKAAAGFDAERHRAALAKKKAKQAAEANLDKIKNAPGPSQLEMAFDLLVPNSGKADTVAGELIRAISRIRYRDLNDGDLFYEGYGIETCGDAVAYLCENIPNLEDMFEDIARRHLEDDQYSKAIDDIAAEVLDYILYEDPSGVAKQNTEDMFDYNGKDFIRDREWEPKYEIDVDIPENIKYHLDKNHISERDLEWQLSSWDYLGDADITVSDDYIHVEDIDKDTYDELDANLYGWLEQYGDDLDDDYGSYEDEEEEEDYEEEE